jgi:ppGpp synthetase/RelA/SpoT-type nucleotidyltranferase
VKDQEKIDAYLAIRPKYENYCKQVESTLSTALNAEAVFFHDIAARAKTVESFIQKSTRSDEDGRKKYSQPISEITDLAGVRVICYTLEDVKRVCSFIHDQFTVLEEIDVGQKRFDSGKFGYQSMHFIVKFSEQRSAFPEFRIYSDMVCEIQVRTVLQHAWAEIEHKIRYKGVGAENKELGRKFLSLAGLLEVADREFQSIKDKEAELAAKEREKVAEAIISENIILQTEQTNSVDIKLLIQNGEFRKAVDEYNKLIRISPTMHTLFIGRARAKYLMEDIVGAMDDLNTAKKYSPNDPQISNIMDKFLSEKSYLVNSPTATPKLLVKSANRFLAAGNGSDDLSLFIRAEELGLPRPFSLLNRSMANMVQLKLTKARDEISSLKIIIGTPMGINLSVIYCLYDVLVKGYATEDSIGNLRDAVEGFKEYQLSSSPITHLRSGLLLNCADEAELIDAVFGQIEDHVR